MWQTHYNHIQYRDLIFNLEETAWLCYFAKKNKLKNSLTRFLYKITARFFFLLLTYYTNGSESGYVKGSHCKEAEEPHRLQTPAPVVRVTPVTHQSRANFEPICIYIFSYFALRIQQACPAVFQCWSYLWYWGRYLFRGGKSMRICGAVYLPTLEGVVWPDLESH